VHSFLSFLGCDEVLVIHYMPHSETITGYYANLLRHYRMRLLRVAIKEKLGRNRSVDNVHAVTSTTNY